MFIIIETLPFCSLFRPCILEKGKSHAHLAADPHIVYLLLGSTCERKIELNYSGGTKQIKPIK
jgi:hypothetical protein